MEGNTNHGNRIQTMVKAIDKKKIVKVKKIVESNSDKIDIVLELYNREYLTLKRLTFIIEECGKYINISSSVVQRLIKEDKTDLLNIILKNTKVFDTEFVLQHLFHY
jgi:hypothetical protein